jgi:hypothetical protein
LLVGALGCEAGEEGRRAAAGPDTSSSRSAPVEAKKSAEPLPADSSTAEGEPSGPCPADQLDPDRLALETTWEKGHVHVTGRVDGGAGRTLVLSLSSGGKFVFDEIFRGKRLASIELGSDEVDVTSGSYTPTPSEKAAFDRRGAVSLATASELCLDAALYDRLDLLASRHLPLAPRP